MAESARANPARWWKARSTRYLHRSPRAMFVSQSRRVATAAALLVLSSLIGSVWYLTNHRRLTQMAQILLKDLAGLPVSIHNAHLSMAGTLRLSGVKITTPPGPGGVKALFSAPSLEVRFKWLSLLAGRLRATRITATDPQVNLIRDHDTGSWNYQALGFGTNMTAGSAPGLPRHLPIIVIRGAKICFARIAHGRYRQTQQTTVDARLAPDPISHAVFELRVTQRRPSGKLGAQAAGSWDVKGNALNASVTRLVLNRTLRRTLPLSVQRLMRRLRVKGALSHVRIAISPRHASMRLQLRDFNLTIPFASRFHPHANIPLRHVSGTVEVSSRGIQAQDIHGLAFGYNFSAPRARFDGFSANAPFSALITAPPQQFHRQFPAVFFTRALDVARQVIQRVRPHGKLSVYLHLRRRRRSGGLAFRGHVRCINVSGRYAHFPLPVHRVSGLVHFSNQRIRFDHLRGAAGQAKITVDGTVGIRNSRSPIHLLINCPSAVFDQRLAAALPRAVVPMWKLFNPRGRAGFSCLVHKKEGVRGIPAIDVTVHVQDVHAMYVGFPYPLRHLNGTVLFNQNRTRILHLTAQAPGGGTIALHGLVRYPAGNLRQVKARLHVHAVGIPMTPELRGALPQRYRYWVRRFKPAGTFDFTGPVQKTFGGSPTISGDISMHNGKLAPADLPWPLTRGAIQAHLAGATLTVQSFTAHAGIGRRGTLALSAAASTSAAAGGTQVHVKGSWTHVKMGATAPALLPEKFAALWNKWKLQGRCSGTFSMAATVKKPAAAAMRGSPLVALQQSAGASAGLPAHAPAAPQRAPAVLSQMTFQKIDVGLRAEGLSFQPTFLPKPMRHIRGVLTMSLAGAHWHDLHGHSDAMLFSTSGSYTFANKLLQTSLNAHAKSLPLALLTRLPKPVAGFLRPLHPHAAWTVRVNNLTGSWGHRWRFMGQVAMHNVATGPTFAAKAGSVQIFGAGSYVPQDHGINFKGNLTAKQMEFSGRPVRILRAEIHADAKRHRVALRHIDGKAAGGALSGHVHFAFGGPIRYAAKLILSNASLRRLAAFSSPVGKANKKVGRGRMTADVSASGRWGTAKGRKASGSLIVRNGKIYNVPLAMGLLQVVTLHLPVSSAFQTAQMSYRLRRNTVQFRQIRLHSRGINLHGQGALNIKTRQLYLRLYTSTPGGFTIPVLGPLINLARDALLGLKVSGPIDHPRVQAMPLNTVGVGL